MREIGEHIEESMKNLQHDPGPSNLFGIFLLNFARICLIMGAQEAVLHKATELTDRKEVYT